VCESDTKATGAVGWCDLTTERADELRDFYRDVVGWTVAGFDMGGYQDYVMSSAQLGRPVAGICHARGANADVPRQWLLYFNVADLDKSLALCRQMGGKVLVPPRQAEGHGSFAVISDPSGAVAALFQPSNPPAPSHDHCHEHEHEDGTKHSHG
jgi:predicted enzyme related to lactoylglutathione lyase